MSVEEISVEENVCGRNICGRKCLWRKFMLKKSKTLCRVVKTWCPCSIPSAPPRPSSLSSSWSLSESAGSTESPGMLVLQSLQTCWFYVVSRYAGSTESPGMLALRSLQVC